MNSDLAAAEGVGDEVAAVGRYIVNNPVLSAAQAAGSFVGPGLAVKGATTAARAGRAGGVAAGAAMAGGDAAGTAHDLATQAGATDEQAVAAGRQASVIPAIVGGVGGAFGAEKLLAGAKGFAGGTAARALKTGASEALQEGIEEGVTQYEGQRAALPYDPNIDPSKGVAGAAAMGAALGGITGAGMGVFDGIQEARHQQASDPLSRRFGGQAEPAPRRARPRGRDSRTGVPRQPWARQSHEGGDVPHIVTRNSLAGRLAAMREAGWRASVRCVPGDALSSKRSRP